ncbi:MAG: ComEC/Rec2 family competence protein [Calditrichaeota bacterium]|nr:ComEC/Rec2 family competence protein [Calditrichota bacterium]
MKVAIDGVLNPCKAQRNPGDFNSKAWRERNGFIGELISTAFNDFTIIDRNLPLIYKVRNNLSDRIERFHKNNSPLIKALLLGIRRDIEPELKENLRVTGLSHLLALSGLHIGFLAGIMIAFGAILRLSPRWRYGLAIVGIVLFIYLVPTRSCTLRAGIMSSAFLIAPVLKRWSPPLNILAFAALIILCLRPDDLFDAGFQLSFAAVGGIIIFIPLSENINTYFKRYAGRFFRMFRQFLLKPVLISCAATVSVLPLTAYHFGMASFGAPLFNLAALPLLALIFAGAWLVMGLSFVWSGLAALTADGLGLIIVVWKWICHFFACYAPCWNGRLAPFVVIALICGIIWLSIQRHKYWKKLFIFSLLIPAVLLWSFSFSNRNFQAWFLDVGHGDAQVWRFPSGQTAVIDGGPVSMSHYGGAVAKMLKFYYIAKIDLMVASHPEADHIGGLIELLDKFAVGLAIKSTVSSETKTYAKLCRASDENDVKWITAAAGSEIHGLPAGFQLSVLAPPVGSEYWSANNASVVLLLEATVDKGKTLRLLTTGDIEGRGERAIVARGGIEAELLKLPHHGSPTSSSPEFIAAVNPELAVVTRGGTNENRRYSSIDEVLNRLRAGGIEIHHTGVEGAILFEPVYVDGKAEWQIVDWRNPPFLRWLFGTI